MNAVGIDIGSSAVKVVALGEHPAEFVLPTGWSSRVADDETQKQLLDRGIDVLHENTRVVATGYGRKLVTYAAKQITEITCHARGGQALAGENCTVIDIGGQDTKVIRVANGVVAEFLMNDKCAAGTGKFVEIMATRLEVDIPELFDLAQKGTALPISSLCTVFAESEIISYIGEARPRQDIAAGVIASVAGKVATLCLQQPLQSTILLTGGLSQNLFFADVLSDRLGQKVSVAPNDKGRYAGALGAALLAQNLA